jgi:hypothetical protein
LPPDPRLKTARTIVLTKFPANFYEVRFKFFDKEKRTTRVNAMILVELKMQVTLLNSSKTLDVLVASVHLKSGES